MLKREKKEKINKINKNKRVIFFCCKKKKIKNCVYNGQKYNENESNYLEGK